MKKCDDTISRQMAIDAIIEMQTPILWSEFEKEQDIFKGMAEALRIIKELPAMPPQKKYLAEIKIDNEKLQEYVNKAVDTILQQIIYCKDCRFFNEEFQICERPHGMSFSYLKEDDYCSYAEKKG